MERQTSVPLLVLWNVFLFWVAVAATHSQTLLLDTVLETALGICFIVGITLNTNAYAMWAESRKVDHASAQTHGPALVKSTWRLAAGWGITGLLVPLGQLLPCTCYRAIHMHAAALAGVVEFITTGPFSFLRSVRQ